MGMGARRREGRGPQRRRQTALSVQAGGLRLRRPPPPLLIRAVDYILDYNTYRL